MWNLFLFRRRRAIGPQSIHSGPQVYRVALVLLSASIGDSLHGIDSRLPGISAKTAIDPGSVAP